ncbi:hypothetical protein EAH79_06005 [Sphingomonas koreensis]|nr:hypothetical protein EAH79_06005 [Sphingomonas koreensis]
MNDHSRPLRPADAAATQMVTASTLVRQFGLWQERAARAPVYILHRGRPRLVLTSTDLMQALCTADRTDEADGDGEALLGSIRELVLILDDQLRITRISAGARAYYATESGLGATLDQLSPGPATAFMIEIAHRVIERGVAETVEIESARRPGRRLSVDVLPWRSGVAMFGHDITTAEQLKDATGHVRAIDQALAAITDAAAARINLRGYLEAPTPSLAALTGIAVDTLASVRFVTLLEVGSRVAVAEAIEGVIADGQPRGVAAQMPVNRAGSRAVRIGLSLLRRGVAPDGVAAVLIGDGPAGAD